MSDTPSVRYRFRLPDGSERVYDVAVGPESISHSGQTDGAPSWTLLDTQKCPHCPLESTEGARCPAALSIWELVETFDGLASFERVGITVETAERTVVAEDVPLQAALRSLMGLILPTCGCPYTAMFRPMARFHLPLASVEETIFRSASAYLLAEWFAESGGGTANYDLKGLSEKYDKVKVVNKYLVKRFSRETETDASVNAVVMLDVLAQVIPIVVKRELEDLRPLFEADRATNR